MVYRRARRRDIATQGEAAADDLHMVMDDRGHFEMLINTTATRSVSPLLARWDSTQLLEHWGVEKQSYEAPGPGRQSGWDDQS